MSAPEALVGALFAEKFQIERMVGEGGMGWVYEATNTLTHGRVAIKIVREDRAEPSIVRRMVSEARTLAKLAHPNIVRLFDAGTWDGQFYLVEEFIDGRSLRDVLSDQLVLDRRAVIELLVPLLDALEYAHARHVVHRDIKPENILLASDGRALQPKLIDFSIALALSEDRHTRAGTVLGTPRYMSPEQAWGRDDIDARTDLWSLAAVAYECISGSPPYEGPNDRAVLAEIVANDPAPLGSVAHSVDEQLADVVMRALVRARDQRVQSAVEWRDALLSLDGPVRDEPWFIALRARYGLNRGPAPSVEPNTPAPPAELPADSPTAPPVVAAVPAQSKRRPSTSLALTITLASLVAVASLAFTVAASKHTSAAAPGAAPVAVHPVAPLATSARVEPIAARVEPRNAGMPNVPSVVERSVDAAAPVVPPTQRSSPVARTSAPRSTRDAAAPGIASSQETSATSSASSTAVSVGTNRAPIVEDEP